MCQDNEKFVCNATHVEVVNDLTGYGFMLFVDVYSFLLCQQTALPGIGVGMLW